MSDQKFHRGNYVVVTVDVRAGGASVPQGAIGIVQGRAPIRDSDPNSRYYSVRFGNGSNYAVVSEVYLKHENELDEFTSEVQ
jgi:hypothetical protein